MNMLPSLQALKLVAASGLVYILYGVCLLLTRHLRNRSLARSKGACLSPPSLPQRDPIFGIDRFLERQKNLKAHRLLQANSERFKRMGVNTIGVVILGKRIVVTIEPEILKVIQAVDFKKWGLGEARKVGFRPLLGDGIFTTDGAEWAHSREMLRPNFVRSQIADFDAFEHHVSRLIAIIPKDGSTIDLSDLFFRLTMDSATEFLFGESTDSLLQPNVDSGFAAAFNRSQEFIGQGGGRWGLWREWFPWLFPENEFENDRKFVHDFVDYYVHKGLAKRPELLAQQKSSEKTDTNPSSKRYLFIDEIVRQTSDPVRIRSELLNILLAGRDTTASLLTNLWHTLSHRPDLYTRLQDEIASFKNLPPTYEQLKNLKYLRALLHESLRLHPVVPSNSREALEDTTLPIGGGSDGLSPLFIPKGQVVVWSVYSMHRRPELFGSDADLFNPNRWLDDLVTGKKGLRTGWEFLPFNGGARICLGQQYALAEAGYVTVRLAQAFAKVEGRGDPVWKEKFALTCTNLDGAKVGFTPRV